MEEIMFKDKCASRKRKEKEKKIKLNSKANVGASMYRLDAT
jgi:hypothetical protein